MKTTAQNSSCQWKCDIGYCGQPCGFSTGHGYACHCKEHAKEYLTKLRKIEQDFLSAMNQ